MHAPTPTPTPIPILVVLLAGPGAAIVVGLAEATSEVDEGVVEDTADNGGGLIIIDGAWVKDDKLNVADC